MRSTLLPTLFLASLLSGCAFHSSATHWNGRVDPDGRPVHVKTTTVVGFNLLVLIRLIGGTNTDGMIDELTAEIAAEGGDGVRIIQTTSENYWYGFPPFTWILTPVISNVAADYRPSEEALAEAQGDGEEVDGAQE